MDCTKRTIKVLGKGSKERIVPMHDSLLPLIAQYKVEWKKHFGGDISPFFLVTDKGDPCYPMMVYRTVRKYLDEHTTIDKRSPHVMRHTFATHLLD